MASSLFHKSVPILLFFFLLTSAATIATAAEAPTPSTFADSFKCPTEPGEVPHGLGECLEKMTAQCYKHYTYFMVYANDDMKRTLGYPFPSPECCEKLVKAGVACKDIMSKTLGCFHNEEQAAAITNSANELFNYCSRSR